MPDLGLTDAREALIMTRFLSPNSQASTNGASSPSPVQLFRRPSRIGNAATCPIGAGAGNQKQTNGGGSRKVEQRQHPSGNTHSHSHSHTNNAFADRGRTIYDAQAEAEFAALSLPWPHPHPHSHHPTSSSSFSPYAHQHPHQHTHEDASTRKKRELWHRYLTDARGDFAERDWIMDDDDDQELAGWFRAMVVRHRDRQHAQRQSEGGDSMDTGTDTDTDYAPSEWKEMFETYVLGQDCLES